ncbi:hypothetical protein C0U41_29830, partial [Klebsiella pneumoniae]
VFTAAAAGLSRAGVYRVCRQRRRGAAPGATLQALGFHRRRCRSITGWSLSSLPPAPPRRSAWGNSAG